MSANDEPLDRFDPEAFDHSDIPTTPLTLTLLKMEVQFLKERVSKLEREAFNGMLELRREINELKSFLNK